MSKALKKETIKDKKLKDHKREAEDDFDYSFDEEELEDYKAELFDPKDESEEYKTDRENKDNSKDWDLDDYDKEEAASDTETKDEEEEEKRSILPIILCVFIAIFGLGLGGYKIYSIQHEYAVAENEYKELSQYTEELKEPEAMVEEPVEEKKEEEEELKRNYNRWDYPSMGVNFEGLAEINPQIVAWLYVGAVDMSYPVVQGEDNEYYLNHTFEDVLNGAGCVFMDSEVNPDLSSYNTFFFGHNMKNGTMFGSLKRFLREEGLYETDPYIFVFNRDGIYRYKIFSIYLDKPNTPMYWICNSFKEYRQYVRKAKENSDIEINVEATENNNMITLVTCSGTGAGKKREFVHATFVDRYLYLP
ncbi:MAG: class B sortase [Lachnospiraceae bacterium]|nr:class B sortase [Lachnospiraceae bacterium]